MMEVRKSGFLRTILLMLIVMLFCSVVHGTIIHVNNNGLVDFDNIQAGIDAAMDGDTVLVTPGEYVISEPITFRGKAITVQSEAGQEQTTIRMGTPSDSNRGSVVIFENNETSESVLDGFTITGGSGSWVPSESAYGGGGIFFDASSGSVRNCAIVQNSADGGGGVLAYSGASPILINCAVEQNTAKSGGGVMAYPESSATLTNCIIKGNSATGVTMWVDGFGGGLNCAYNSLLTLTNCSITENTAGISSGGVFCGTSSSITMTHCTITNNTSQRYCGVMECAHGSVFLTNCLMTRNTGAWNGGALGCVWSDSSMTISNCTIWGNKAGQSAGGIGCWHGSSVTATNSIIWENTSPIGREIEVRDSGSTLNITYSNVAGGQNVVSVEGGSILNWGASNIDVDPLFADPNNNDFHLKSEAGRWDPNIQSWIQDDITSPCIDAGDPNSDWRGEVWPHGERTNMGAYGSTPQASMSLETDGMSLSNVAFIYSHKSEEAESFQSLLVDYGCPTTLVRVVDVPVTPLDSYDLIILANDTKYEHTWSDPNTVAAIEDSGKPVVGLGDGGYDFFGLLGLSIGNPYGGHISKNSIEVIDPNSSLFTMPYSIEIPQDRVLQLYTETNSIGIYLWPTIPETVTVFGSEVNVIGYYPLVAEHNRYILWGFTESPQKMTEIGKILFINIIIHTTNGIWGS